MEYFQMTKERRLDNSEWPLWLNQAWQKPLIEKGSFFCSPDGGLEGEKATPVFLNTINGIVKVHWGDYIFLTTDRGEIMTCNPSIFERLHVSEKRRKKIARKPEVGRDDDVTCSICNTDDAWAVVILQGATECPLCSNEIYLCKACLARMKHEMKEIGLGVENA